MNTSFDRQGHPLRVEVISLNDSCAAGAEGLAVIMIGSRVWFAEEPGEFTEARIAARLPRRLTSEVGRFRKLLAAASDIHEGELGLGRRDERIWRVGLTHPPRY